MVIKQTEVEQYNYLAFKGGESDFLGFRSQLQVGSLAPDFTATALENGEWVQLKDYWKDGNLVIEFGSLT